MSTRGADQPQPAPTAKPQQRSRASTKPITLHLNPETRAQLKLLAAEQQCTVAELGVEAFNLLFARCRKPEIARR